MTCRVCRSVMRLAGWWQFTGGPRNDVYHCPACRRYR